ncbi:uncharacterized protein LOC120352792 [Nilaparvata lugens]|uniref:uncharacterized protein LOC120352792 n=1 Tax=Nilaparvata lugens TaxID=108931 RepID=UPI00193E0D5C|nr:uncharacterized protein LOC120352792 [Nilaparvata lugens]
MFAQEAQLNTIMNKFWETEEAIPVRKKSSPEDELCEKLYQSTTYRTSEGRYVVALPFKPGTPALCNNRSKAYRNQLGLLKKLSQSDELETKYSDFMHEYRDLGHLKIADSAVDYIIPHHAIFKKNDNTQKIRVVFNASSKDANGLSLNDVLLPGAKLQTNIVQILTHSRSYHFVILADCKQMYRQILLRPEDRQHQHIFWKPTHQEKIQEFELLTVTYGVSPSAYLAQRTLQQLVEDEGEAFPLASQVLKLQMYVDDILGGSNDLNTAHSLIKELNELLSLASFELRRWNSNTPELIEHMSPKYLSNQECLFDDTATTKVLGIVYSPLADDF